MFRKLRQKIENEPTQENGSGTSSSARRVEEGRRSSRQSNMKRTDSLNSLNSSDDTPTESSSKEDLYSMLMHRTTQVKRLEVKLAEYGQSLKERSRECEKLSNALERQQDSALRKLNELNETYANDKKRYESTITRLEKSDIELSTTAERLQEENDALRSRVEQWDLQKEEFEQQKTEFYAKRDNSEEIHDLQRQELAKLKHMLMNSEKDAKSLQQELDENVASLIQSRDRNDELEALLRESSVARETIQTALSDVTDEKEKLSLVVNEAESARKKLLNQNADLKNKLSSVALDLQKTRSNLTSVENAHNSLEDKYEYLKHNSEAVFNKAQGDLEESAGVIRHLEGKLKMLEIRSTTEKLPQDEQIQALLDERSSLEQKLEESHQQLMNIKSTWSDRINHLETQVTHLNAKIVEDCDELSQKTIELEKIKKEKDAKENSFTMKIKALEEENSDLLSHNDVVLQQIAEIEAKLIEQQAIHDLNVNKANKRESDLDQQARNLEKELRVKIDKLSEQLKESATLVRSLKLEHEETLKQDNAEIDSMKVRLKQLIEEVNDKQIEITNREKINNEMALSLEEVRRDRDSARERNDQLEKEFCEQRERLKETEDEVERLSKDLAICEENFTESEAMLESVTSQLNAVRSDLNEKHEGLLQSQGSSDEKEEKLKDLTDKVSDLNLNLETRTKELMVCKEELAYLKNNQAEEGEEVKTLRFEKARLEDRILDKDRTLKLHQQRLSDIKKTLQKELTKNQAATSESSRSADLRLSGGKQASKLPQKSDSTSGVPPNGSLLSQTHNGLESEEANPLPSLLSGDMSLDDPSLSDGQRDVVIKYLKHVVLTFISCEQPEALQLIRAISAVLHFTQDEEKLVRDVLEYRANFLVCFAPESKKRHQVVGEGKITSSPVTSRTSDDDDQQENERSCS